MKKTAWFPAHIKPVRRGMYEVSGDGTVVYFSHWNGRFWGHINMSQVFAFEDRLSPSFNQRRRWRGLTKETS